MAKKAGQIMEDQLKQAANSIGEGNKPLGKLVNSMYQALNFKKCLHYKEGYCKYFKRNTIDIHCAKCKKFWD